MNTTLDQTTYAELARRLEEAERARVQLRPFSIEHPGFTMDDAYAVQAEWMKLKLAGGRTVKGHKIGLTSRAMQINSGIDTPDSGLLLDDMFYYDGAEIPFERFIQPRVEVELGFVLGRDLAGPDCTIFDVLDAVDYVVPAIEIIDSRFFLQDPETGKGRKVVDTISDNACNAALVIGGNPIRPGATDLRWIGALLHRNHVIEETGLAAGVLNHPANGLVWLANRMAATGVGALRKGDFVLGGSFTRPVFAGLGEVFHVDYGPLGAITCRFA